MIDFVYSHVNSVSCLQVYGWDATTYTVQMKLVGHRHSVVAVAIVYNPTERAVTADDKGNIKIWNLDRDQGTRSHHLQALSVQGSDVQNVFAFTPTIDRGTKPRIRPCTITAILATHYTLSISSHCSTRYTLVVSFFMLRVAYRSVCGFFLPYMVSGATLVLLAERLYLYDLVGGAAEESRVITGGMVCCVVYLYIEL